MNKIPTAIIAGQRLKQLIKANYKSQEEFAWDFGIDLRTVSRYCNQGLSDTYIIDSLEEFFRVEAGYLCKRDS